jgi:hypothetical protein
VAQNFLSRRLSVAPAAGFVSLRRHLRWALPPSKYKLIGHGRLACFANPAHLRLAAPLSLKSTPVNNYSLDYTSDITSINARLHIITHRLAGVTGYFAGINRVVQARVAKFSFLFIQLQMNNIRSRSFLYPDIISCYRSG